MFDYKNFIWNPSDMREAYAFYKKKHTVFLQEFITRIFSKNSYKMRIRPLAVTKRLIESQSSVYKSTVKREFIGTQPDTSFSTMKNILTKMEEHLNLFGVAAIFTYLNADNELVPKPIPAHRFSVRLEGEQVSELIIKIGERRELDNSIIEIWNWYKDGNIIKMEGRNFNSLVAGAVVGVYTFFPIFVIFQDPEEPSAIVSDFVEIEKDMVANLSLNRLSAAIALLKLLVAPQATDEDVAHIADIVGNMTGIVGLPNTVQGLQSLDMGSMNNNIDFSKLNKEELRMIAVQNGADYTALDVDENIESGKAKELKLSYMQSARASRVPEWEQYEYQIWKWLHEQDQANFKQLSYIDFGTLDISLSATEKQELKESQARMDYEQLQRGVLLLSEYVSKWNEGQPEKVLKQIEETVTSRLI